MEFELDQLERWFTYHPARGDQPERYTELRQAGKNLALTILKNCPSSADRSAAIHKVREAVMTANAAIACEAEVSS